MYSWYVYKVHVNMYLHILVGTNYSIGLPWDKKSNYIKLVDDDIRESGKVSNSHQSEVSAD